MTAHRASDLEDNCPQCLEGPNEPVDSSEQGANVSCLYRCGMCGHEWSCSWNLQVCRRQAPSDAGGVRHGLRLVRGRL